jgi:multidrug/hemolysin transport system ATP-binding protein
LDHIIEVTGLQKSYGPVHAVKGNDFYVESGKIFAFLGPNGAGKSTTIDIICTFLQADAGRVVVDGHTLGKDDNAIRHSIGAVFQDGLLDPLLSVQENLRIRAGFYGLKGKRLNDVIAEVAERVGISEILKRPLRQALRRAAASLRHCPRACQHAENPLSRRADHRARPQTRKSVWETITKLQHDTGMTIISHHALYGRGGGGGFRHRHRQRQHRRQGHAVRPEGALYER